jgi:hypothetical protein
MTEFIPSEKGMSIRFPSTANLCIDSNDRVGGYLGGSEPDTSSPFDFQITRKANIMTGFFTRICATEFVLDWAEPNIQTGFNNTFEVDVSGQATTTTVSISQGFYTVADILDELVVLLNATSTGTWSVSQSAGNQTGLRNATNNFTVIDGTLASQLFPYYAYYNEEEIQYLESPDVRLYRYIDVVSDQLTYNQNLKDDTTNRIVNNVICRIYLTSAGFDTYGFPIKFGYKADTLYRNFPFPKQINWDNTQPIGNIQFRVFGNLNKGNTSMRIIDWDADTPTDTNWMITLQVSEV